MPFPAKAHAPGIVRVAGGAPTQQPPTFDAVATVGVVSNTDPNTLTDLITIGAGTNRRLLVWVCDDDSRSITAVRLTNMSGTLFTALGTETSIGGARGRWFELRDVPVGLTTLWVDLAGLGRIGVVAYSLRDCHASANVVVGTAVTTNVAVTSLAPTVTPAFDAAMVLSAVMESNGTSQGNTAITPQNGQTASTLVEMGTIGNSTATMIGGRTIGPTPAALVTHGWAFNRSGGITNGLGQAISVPGLLA